MKTRKTLLLLVLAVVFSIVLAACGNSSPSTESSSAAGEEPGTAETNTNGGNILIVYFSHTGNTEEVAGQIADLTGGTLAEIQRAEEYGDLQEEAEAKILEGVHPEITVSVDNVEDYDTIFVGYLVGHRGMARGFVCRGQ